MNERQLRILLLGMLLSTVTIVGVFFIGLVWLSRRMAHQSDRVLGQSQSLGADAAGRELEQSLQYEDIQRAFARIERGQAALAEILDRVSPSRNGLDPRDRRE